MATILRLLKPGSIDLDTVEGRGLQRYRLAMLSMLANVGSRGLSMAAMVLSVSLTAPYLGVERFGVWMTITSFSAMLTFLDLGVGNALTNHVAKCAAGGDRAELQRAISGGLGFMAVLGATISVALVLLSTVLPWSSLIKTPRPKRPPKR